MRRASPGAERRADRDFSASCRRPGKQQVGGVCARDQEQHPDRAEHQEQPGRAERDHAALVGNECCRVFGLDHRLRVRVSKRREQ